MCYSCYSHERDDREQFERTECPVEWCGQALKAEPEQEEERYPEASDRQLLLSEDASSNCICEWKMVLITPLADS